MSEIRTPPVEAQHIPDKDEFKAKRLAGSYRIDPVDPDERNEQWFWYCCPCGCGAMAPIVVGNGFKPAEGPSWTWNGSTEKPDLKPSVHHRGHWHGWLNNGVWESC